MTDQTELAGAGQQRPGQARPGQNRAGQAQPTQGRPLQAQDKLAFLLALVPYLIDQDGVSVAETAAHFRVAEEEIREAVRLIAISGVPGETGQYQHGDLFDISWDDFEENDRIVLNHNVGIDYSPKFSGKEAAALIAGLQYLSALPEQANRDAIGSLMAKLARGASAAPSEVAVAERDTDTTIEQIRDAVNAGTQIEFDYLNSRGVQERRRVDPLRIESADQDWYLRGWCHGRKAIRTFRLDRMSDLRTTQDAISQRAADTLLPEQLFQESNEDLTVIVELSAPALGLIADYSPEALPADAKAAQRGKADIENNALDDESDKGESDRIRIKLRIAHYHGLKRLIAGLPGVLTVIAPDEARHTIESWAAAGAERYEAV